MEVLVVVVVVVVAAVAVVVVVVVVYLPNQPTNQSINLPIYLSVYLSASLKTQLFYENSSIFEFDNVKNRNNSARRPQFSNSARLPQFSKLTTSKTKQFCETSFKNGKLSAELIASCQCVLPFFHST